MQGFATLGLLAIVHRMWNFIASSTIQWSIMLLIIMVLDLGHAAQSNNESLYLPSGLESENAVNFFVNLV